MKIKIKSREEIEKTLDESNHHIDMSGAYFANQMFLECGKHLEAKSCGYFGYSARADSPNSASGGWSWHPDWYEVIEDFTEEDEFIIQELDEMLEYFMDNKGNNEVTDESVRIFIEEFKERHKELLKNF